MKNYSNTKTGILIVIMVLIIITLGMTYAFFNYTRTGGANIIKVGQIEFATSQDNTINLTNVFPVSSDNLDSTNSATVTININGSTTYSSGIEYKVIIDDVYNTINDKEVPISFMVEATDLGEKSNDYYHDRGSTDNVYNLVESGKASDDQLIMIGYIKSDNVGVNGSIDITAYIDKDDVGISDTVSRIDNGNLVYGETGGDWIAGRTIFTTSEWNNIETNQISFKVKVEAQEGIWVNEPDYIILKNLNGIQDWKDIRASITSIEFHKDGLAPSSYITSFDATDLTSSGEVTVYKVDDGLENDTFKAIIVGNDVIYAPENSSGLFMSMSLLKKFNSDNFRVDNVTNMASAFRSCTKLENIDGLINWNVANVSTMNGMFYGCTSLKNIDGLINWNTSSVENMFYLFRDCTSLENVNGLINWNTSNVTSMKYNFLNCISLENVDGLINWNTSSVTDMNHMFSGCSSLTTLDLHRWNTENVENISFMFYNCTNLTTLDLNGWNTENVWNLGLMFYNCTNLTALDLSGWNLLNETIAHGMFYNCSNLISLNVSNWNTSGVINMSLMFYNCSKLSQIDVGSWNTSNVQKMDSMFELCSNLSSLNLSKWNTSSVTDMSFMFNKCTSLSTIDLSSWDMSKVTNDSGMFQSVAATTIIVPNNYTRIDNFMFNQNSNYNGESFTLPKSVATIGNSHVFYNFGKDGVFNKFIVESGSTLFKTIDDILYTNDGTRLISIPRGKVFTNRIYEMPEGVTFLNELSFSRSQNIDKVVLPNSYVIERYILANDNNNVNNNYGFINSGNSLSVAIYRYTTIKEYEVKNDNSNYSSDNGCIYSKDGIELIAVPLHYTGVLNIKSGATTIGQEAFWVDEKNNIDNITEINIPASVTTIEANQLTTLNYLMSRSTNPVTITIDSGNTAYHIVNNQIVAI